MLRSGGNAALLELRRLRAAQNADKPAAAEVDAAAGIFCVLAAYRRCITLEFRRLRAAAAARRLRLRCRIHKNVAALNGACGRLALQIYYMNSAACGRRVWRSMPAPNIHELRRLNRRRILFEFRCLRAAEAALRRRGYRRKRRVPRCARQMLLRFISKM